MKCRLVVIASSCTSTLVGVKAALGVAVALAGSARGVGAEEAVGMRLVAAVLTGPLLECAPSQPPSVSAQLARAHLGQKLG
jgi:hypothetical protein